MVLEEEYSQGLDSFLRGGVDKKDLADITKAILHYTAYTLPFYGLVDQYKKPKEERAKAGIFFSDIVAASFAVKFIVFPVYILGKGVATGNWHPFKFNEKEKIEQVDDISRKDKRLERKKGLEKTVNYQELLIK